MKMTHIEIPPEFNRNARFLRSIPVEETGLHLIKLACQKTGISDLSDKDILDVGCGSRFTATIINCDVSIKSYTGIEVAKKLVNYLSTNVIDSRFSFYRWNMYNFDYNKKGEKLTKETPLPTPPEKKFDVVWMFSVITHFDPIDAENFFHVLRKYVKLDTRLLFSAYIDNNIDSHQHVVQEEYDYSVSIDYYREDVLRKILADTGWRVDGFYPPEQYIQHHFVCSPDPDFLIS